MHELLDTYFQILAEFDECLFYFIFQCAEKLTVFNDHMKKVWNSTCTNNVRQWLQWGTDVDPQQDGTNTHTADTYTVSRMSLRMYIHHLQKHDKQWSMSRTNKTLAFSSDTDFV